ncbi:hypothetical protein [Kitasatospora sp. NPDC051914]|uniref:hypothetical protein n=1 Tax=Kitasatospora sp. NPDC051914 TaxID=3154945 RepID=UPI00342562F6
MIDSRLRANVLELLKEVLTPVRLAELNAMLVARHGEGISREEFSELIAADRAEYVHGGATAPILVPGLGVADGAADYDCITRSDWAIKMRLSGPDLEASRSLAMVRWMCDQLDIAKEEGSSAFSPLEHQIRDMAQMIPDDVLEEYEAEMHQEMSGVQFEIFRNAAEDYSSDLRRHTQSIVDSATSRLSRLPKEAILFGSQNPPRIDREGN